MQPFPRSLSSASSAVGCCASHSPQHAWCQPPPVTSHMHPAATAAQAAPARCPPARSFLFKHSPVASCLLLLPPAEAQARPSQAQERNGRYGPLRRRGSSDFEAGVQINHFGVTPPLQFESICYFAKKSDLFSDWQSQHCRSNDGRKGGSNIFRPGLCEPPKCPLILSCSQLRGSCVSSSK